MYDKTLGIMKRMYITPQMETVQIKAQTSLLTTSGSGNMNAPESNFDFNWDGELTY